MIIYLLNIISIPIYRLFIKKDRVFCLVVSMQLFLILALRSELLGVDLKNYKGLFETVSNMGFEDMASKFSVIRRVSFSGLAYEWGYVAINWVFARLGLSFHQLLVIFAGFNMFSIGKYIYRYSEQKALSFILFIGFGGFEYCFGLLRYWIALSIFLLALPLLHEGKRLKYIIVIVLSVFIYRSLVICLLLAVLFDKEINKRQLTYILFVFLVLLLLSNTLYDKYVYPILAWIDKPSLISNFQWNNFIILMAVMYVFIYLFISSRYFKRTENNIAMWCFIISVFIEILGMNNGTFARLVWLFFVVFEIILIPNIVAEFRPCQIRWAGHVMIFLLMTIWMTVSYPEHYIVPYKTIFVEGLCSREEITNEYCYGNRRPNN